MWWDSKVPVASYCTISWNMPLFSNPTFYPSVILLFIHKIILLSLSFFLYLSLPSLSPSSLSLSLSLSLCSWVLSSLYFMYILLWVCIVCTMYILLWVCIVCTMYILLCVCAHNTTAFTRTLKQVASSGINNTLAQKKLVSLKTPPRLYCLSYTSENYVRWNFQKILKDVDFVRL